MQRTPEGTPPIMRLGTSSFSEADWIGPFYPKGTKSSDFLSYYATRYTTVEIDATYYAIPSRRTVEGWRRKTSDGFLFSAKFPRSIVHGGEGPRPNGAKILLPEATYGDRDRFLETMNALGDRLGPLVLQFPYFARDVFDSPTEFMDRLERFLVDLSADYRYAVEIRNRAWLSPGFADLLRRYRIGLVLVDQTWMPHGDEVTGEFDPVTAGFVYIRLLGDRKEIEALTTTWDKEVIDRRERLERWADLVARLVERQVETLIYVNNHYAGHAPATADRLHDMISQRLGGR